MMTEMEDDMKRLVAGARVLVMDGAAGLVLRNEGDAVSPSLVLVRSYGQDNPPTRDLGSDKPGRTNESTGLRRSSMETTDLHQQAEDRFVHKIASEMAGDLAAGQFETLIVAAPPVALGHFRKSASAALKAAVMAEIDKDFTKHPVSEIQKHVVKALEAG
jgi:protein required for attachment to host cells